jgi:formylglycine-generating enzyme required for sulfatase activity
MTPSSTRRPVSLSAALALAALLVATCVAPASAVTIPTVPVGNAGNAGDVQSQGTFGAVAYNYRIGSTEVTNAQYAEFLNATGATNAYAYNTISALTARAGITRSGSGTLINPYTYTTRPNMGDKPVIYVSWINAIRFVNWLHNGQGDGDTETGAYTLGALDVNHNPYNGENITRNPGATWFLPSEDEWYKAAYYDPTLNDGSGGYWHYPTRSNSSPTIATADSTGNISNPGANVANTSSGADWNGQNGNVTTVGSAGFLAESYYGTSDQGGNVEEWNESLIIDPFLALRGIRGGSWSDSSTFYPRASNRTRLQDVVSGPELGFRVATVPEPSTLLLGVLGMIGLLWWRSRRK